MSNLQAALLHGLKVLGHVALAGAITGIVAYVKHDPTLMIYSPAVNVVTATIWKYLFPNEVFPVDSSGAPML